MPRRARLQPLRTAAAAFAAALAVPAQAALCTPDPVPAATLLMPYFEVRQCSQANAERSVVTVSNTQAAPRLAHVTLWSNAAVPVFDFDVYLGGYATQRIDLRALLCDGTLPSTGPGVSEPGRLAAPEREFAGCNAGADPAAGAPVYATLPQAARTELQAALLGEPSPATGLCHALPNPDGETMMIGYVTVDAVERCNAPVGGEPGFAAALDDANVLAGHATVFDPLDNVAFGYAAVAIEAATQGELAGRGTFYDFLGDGADAREPLPTDWGADYSRAAGGRVSLLIWRSPGQAGTAFACANPPAWYPLDFANRSGDSDRGAFAVDDDGIGSLVLRSPQLAPLATQRKVAWPAHADGWLRINLQHSKLPGAARGGQGVLLVVAGQPGRYATEHPAIAFDDGCGGAPFDHVSGGRGASP